MLDADALQRWIRPPHLDEQNLAASRSGFSLHPARLIVIRNFLVEDVATRLGTFLSSEAAYETRYGLYSKESTNHTATKQEWQAAEPNDRFFTFARITGALPACQLSPNALTYLQFRFAWSDAPFTAFFTQVTGLALVPGALDNAQAFTQGDFLLSHRDELDDRRLAVVLYLSKGWRPEYGGELELVDGDGQLTTIVPEFNSLVLFDVRANSTHQILPITPAAGDRARVTMGGWVDGGGVQTNTHHPRMTDV